MENRVVNMQSEERAIRDLNATWIEAVNAGDLDRLLPLMTEDVVLIGPGQAPVRREGYPAVFSGGHREFHIRCESAVQEVTVAGDVAYTLCEDRLTVTPRSGGATTTLAGHRITIYRKQADGRWLLARDAHTLAPVAG
jgi:uncharacterized protein (TIGR02246 family)